MSIKYAADVVKEIKGRGAIVLLDDGVCGEDFEKWLKAKASSCKRESFEKNERDAKLYSQCRGR